MAAVGFYGLEKMRSMMLMRTDQHGRQPGGSSGI